ncbi:hypothetical protein MCOR25_010734 [Pyricularia grisea]|uniref:General alpha-glucoside permease n=1 Tax=Pyricularia grisea TaxID=148305 RepID=A0A6P8BF34_PYRGI|nr:uncharacterized protein PgNI_00842 [Pyricularia grisea]KAI6349058.1 hypothetical protein MCOR25_010734 [Pyricularia grisea]TLD15431.1 hypothetical protein PgNI_00842 [Pyricularia grisea]
MPPSSAEPPTASAANAARNVSIDESRRHGRKDPNQNEQSPLLSPQDDEVDSFMARRESAIEDDDDDDEIDPFETTKSVWYLILLTISIGGLQIAWSVELSNGSPYLLSLGLSKSLMALVWIAGPLSGTLVQPYVGMLSDNCRISWGKRKPFMLVGAAATITSLLFLAWTREIVGGILGLFGASPDSDGVKTTIIVVAVLWVYILDFAINTVQAAIRAFILDCAPSHQQEAANSMASRITGVGNIVGYVAGFVNLPKITWWLGKTQFQDLCAIASIALGVTVIISCIFIPERDPRLEGPPPRDQPGVLSFFTKIFTSIKRLPPVTKRVCQVQFCAWVGFFPMLFYTSAYIGEIYVQPFLRDNPNMTPKELDELYERATRVGTFALLIYSITSLSTNVFLPFFIQPTYDAAPLVSADAPGEGPSVLANAKNANGNSRSWLDRLVIPGFTLRRAWMFSHILFAFSMGCTVLVESVEAATVLIGLVGITWALTLWAPWSLISSEISRRDAVLRAQQKRRGLNVDQSYDEDETPSSETSSGQLEAERDEQVADQAGIILGIHNMAIAAPQIIATVGSSIIFKFFQKPRGTPGDRSISIVMALGGITVLGAAWLVHRIDDDVAVPADELSGIMEAGASDGILTGGPPRPSLSQRTSFSSTRPSFSRSRNQSTESLSRYSQERAALVRASSFGGAEY